jgi:hypothetical protein
MNFQVKKGKRYEKILVINILFAFGFSQQITNITQKIENGRVVIDFELQGKSDNLYDITLTATHTNAKTIIPIVAVGRIKNIKPGKSHYI